jgi:hypothetical protein
LRDATAVVDVLQSKRRMIGPQAFHESAISP